jgi:hypothetical protein
MQTVTVNLTESEHAAIASLAHKFGLSTDALLLESLRCFTPMRDAIERALPPGRLLAVLQLENQNGS